MNGERSHERGSALIIALLVTVVLALLGISFLLMAETENRIARNERRAAQALYAAQSTVRVVKSWFDAPTTATLVPGPGQIDRTQRSIVAAADPYDPTDETAADGVIGSQPYYKQQIDLDGNGRDDLFDRPYRDDPRHSFLGSESGPDLVLDNADADAATYFRALEQQMFDGYPGNGLVVRLERIDLYAPPYIRAGANWNRIGLATVRVVVRLVVEASGQVVAEREVRAVISEIPYGGVYGPLHSCEALVFTGSSPSLHWGAVSAIETIQLSPLLSDLPQSLPREQPAYPRGDSLLSGIDWADWAAEPSVTGQSVPDPWVRFIAGDRFVAPVVPTAAQPYPASGWTVGDPPPAGCCDHSNVLQDQLLVGCPSYDYDDWKAIASSGERAVRYFSPDGSLFREDGIGPADSLQNHTNGESGIFFFDTTDGRAPHDDDGDGNYENLTSAVTLSGNWNFDGVLYTNASSVRLNGVTGVNRNLRAPGEPFLDTDGDAQHDAGEPYVNLNYPSTTATLLNSPTIRDSGSYDERGPAVLFPVALSGLLVTPGSFEATGTGAVYGSVVARGGVTQAVSDGSAATPQLIFDAAFLSGYPETGSTLPRVTVTGWLTSP